MCPVTLGPLAQWPRVTSHKTWNLWCILASVLPHFFLFQCMQFYYHGIWNTAVDTAQVNEWKTLFCLWCKCIFKVPNWAYLLLKIFFENGQIATLFCWQQWMAMNWLLGMIHGELCHLEHWLGESWVAQVCHHSPLA